jgi:hypothetical protein
MARSTARGISYDLRPSKQAERRIMMDVLRAAAESGLPIANYRYVGMGAVRFYDFLLIHRYVGVDSMISLEHDDDLFVRAKFNVPYDFIEVRNQGTDAFLAADAFEAPTILWFDYDGGLSPQIVADLTAAALKMKQGDFFFVTVYGGPPRATAKRNVADRLIWLQDTLGDVSGDVRAEDVEDSTFSRSVHKVLMAAFKNAFVSRRDGSFRIFLQVEYKDSVPMVTVGGAFLSNGQAIGFMKKLAGQLPFLSRKADELYEVTPLHITERERSLFDRAATKRGQSAERNALKRLGFKDSELAAYRDLIRYLPRYVEAIV